MTEIIQCGEHGEQETTFVCQHLVASLHSGKPVGFYFAGEPRGDAWCSTCEDVRIREGGPSGDWNERSEAYAGISLLCGACYDRVKSLHGL